MERFAAMSAEEQREALRVPEENSVLRAVMAILKGMELEYAELTARLGIGHDDRCVLAGRLGAAQEAQDLILKRMEEGRRLAK